MPTEVMLAVLCAALLHAGWNALAKAGGGAGGDPLVDTTAILVAGAGVSAVALPFLALPAPASWPFVAASGLIHVAYFRLVAAAYRSGDMSLAYPLSRGTAPLLTALASGSLLGEALGHWKVSTKGARSLHDALGKSEGLARGALVASIADWHVSTYVARPSGEYISLHGKDAIYRMGVQRAIEEAGKANVALALQHVKSAADAHPGLVPSVAGLRRTASLNLAGFQRRLEEMRAVQATALEYTTVYVAEPTSSNPIVTSEVETTSSTARRHMAADADAAAVAVAATDSGSCDFLSW